MAISRVRLAVCRMTSQALQAELDRFDEGSSWNYTEAEMARWDAVAAELDAREGWDHEDARVREAAGNAR